MTNAQKWRLKIFVSKKACTKIVEVYGWRVFETGIPAQAGIEPSLGELMTENLRTLLQHGISQLRDAGLDTPDLDARWLLEAATGLTRAGILAKSDELPSVDALMLFQHFIARRLQREPVARILGLREFWGLNFRLSPATLEPRPDSETLIEAVLEQRPDRARPYRILDLGTGTGCLLAALLYSYPQAQGVALDVNPLALKTAGENFAALGLSERVQLCQSAWYENLPVQSFDMIISNPPYIPSEVVAELAPEVQLFDPLLALDGGTDGLRDYRALINGLPTYLAADGIAVFELGIGQKNQVTALAHNQQLRVLAVKDDLGGITRALLLVK